MEGVGELIPKPFVKQVPKDLIWTKVCKIIMKHAKVIWKTTQTQKVATFVIARLNKSFVHFGGIRMTCQNFIAAQKCK